MDNNKKYLQYLSYFLNNKSSFYNELDVKEVMECGVDEKYALALLLASFFNLDVNDNWNYKDTEFKKQQVKSTGLYECFDDYFIAYKGIRSDRYSKYNFQFQYLPGKTYETFCDCSLDENSFGFLAWAKENAECYCNELVVKVKINYEDVGRVVHDGGKIRCSKMTILE